MDTVSMQNPLGLTLELLARLFTSKGFKVVVVLILAVGLAFSVMAITSNDKADAYLKEGYVWNYKISYNKYETSLICLGFTVGGAIHGAISAYAGYACWVWGTGGCLRSYWNYGVLRWVGHYYGGYCR
jgi:hypothetical protein